MEPSFGHARWGEGQIGFHQATVHDQLEAYADRLAALSDKPRVLVPLCGKSLDMVHLRALGYDVVGVELSEIAAKAFFEEQELTPERCARGKLTCYSAEGVDLMVGDYFDTTPEAIGPVQGLYDRAALVALPPDLRGRYAAHTATLMPEGAPGLLVSFEYPQAEMNGPPFSVLQAEVESLYSGDFEISLLEDLDVLEGNPKFKGRVSTLREKTYLITRR